MEVTTKQFRRCDLVMAKGRIDTATVKILTQALMSLKQAGRFNIVINLKDVTYISSAGLSELIDTHNYCKQKHGQFVLAEVPQRIREVFDLAGLTPMFNIFDSEIEAVASF
jgi:anti-sigma B factor antagonist